MGIKQRYSLRSAAGYTGQHGGGRQVIHRKHVASEQAVDERTLAMTELSDESYGKPVM